MAKRALIAEPDPDEANRQAAILKDDGYDCRTFVDGDLVTELERNAPDILVLRHERPGSQTGLALVSRLKQVARGTAIIITTSDLTPDAIEKNRRQKVHADGYLRLPVERSELVAAARAVPEVQDLEAAGGSQEGAPVSDGRRPPPLPSAAGLRALSQLPKASPRSSGEAVLSTDDLTFVEKVFSTIQHVDADAPIEQPPSTSVGGGAEDRKIALLRSELKRRERELAKLSRLWKAREEDLRQKESRVAQKDIEIEGLRLRINEVSTELERANANLVEKEQEFGRTMGETYDQTALQQAELIQQVAGKENELNALKTKLRRAEDAWAAEKKELAERIFEWEKAYADFDQHHWKVMEASVEEVQRLERQIRAREAERRAAHDVARERELELMKARAALVELRGTVRELEHGHGIFEQTVIAEAHALLMQERAGLREQWEEAQAAQARILDLEEDLGRHQRLLLALDEQRRRELTAMSTAVRAGDAERVRLLGERDVYRLKAQALEQALSLARALGEATAHQLFTLEEKRRVVGEQQIRVRDAKIGDLVEETQRLTVNLADVTERLGQSEMEHAAEQARADDLDRALAETRAHAEETESRLARELEVMIADRDKLADDLHRTRQALKETKEALAEANHSRQQREIEVAGIIEKKDNELSNRAERMQELDRSLADAKEDIANLRKTITLRDERITELLSRVRAADEKQVALEGQVFRLETTNTENQAELVAREERIAQLVLKLSQRDDKVEELEEELRKTNAVVLDREAHIERHEQTIAALQQEIARQREEGARLQGELQQRAAELFESERKGSALAAELQNAKNDIATTGAIVDQLQGQLQTAEQRGQQLRRALEDTDGKLRAALGDLDAAGKRADQMRTDIQGLREKVARTENELSAQKAATAELERMRETLQHAGANLQAKLNEVEQERASLEESLAASTRENGELHASLSDATVRLGQWTERAQALEHELNAREGRIAAMAQVIQRAESTSATQGQELSELREELSEAKHSIEEMKRAIDERAKWLQTREQSIAELKQQLDATTVQKEQTAVQLAQTQAFAQQLQKAGEQLKARLEERERLLKAQQQHGEQQVEKETARADSAARESQQLKAQVEQLQHETQRLGVEAQRAVELRAAEEKARGDALKVRQFAERAANELKATRAALEKSEQERKTAQAEAHRARAEIDDIRNAQKGAEALVTQARAEGEQRQARLNELQQQVQRLTAARDSSERARQEVEQELARTKIAAEQEIASGRGQLSDEVQRLSAELQAAKKQRADAIAAAQQAKAEAEQIKKLAAEKIKQAQAAARGSMPPVTTAPAATPSTQAGRAAPNPATIPPQSSASASQALRPPVSTGQPPSQQQQQQRQQPTGMAPPANTPGVQARTPAAQQTQPGGVRAMPGGMGGLAPPQGAPVTNPGFGTPTVPVSAPVASAPSGPDPYSEQKTVVIEKPVIPSAARGDKR